MPFPFIAAAMLASSALAAKSVADTNKAQKSAAETQMDFQQANSDTAHQREVADLRAAGLNPILSAKYGGSSTPTGAMPTYNAPLGHLANQSVSAYETALTKTQIKRAESESVTAKNESDVSTRNRNFELSSLGDKLYRIKKAAEAAAPVAAIAGGSALAVNQIMKMVNPAKTYPTSRGGGGGGGASSGYENWKRSIHNKMRP